MMEASVIQMVSPDQQIARMFSVDRDRHLARYALSQFDRPAAPAHPVSEPASAVTGATN